MTQELGINAQCLVIALRNLGLSHRFLLSLEILASRFLVYEMKKLNQYGRQVWWHIPVITALERYRLEDQSPKPVSNA